MNMKSAKQLVEKYKSVKDYTSESSMQLIENMLENDIEIDLIFDEEGGNIRFTFDDDTIGRCHFDGVRPEWIELMHNAGVEVWGDGYE